MSELTELFFFPLRPRVCSSLLEFARVDRFGRFFFISLFSSSASGCHRSS